MPKPKKKKEVVVINDVGVLSGEISELQKKHDELYEEISSNLMTKSQIKSGGPDIRVKYEQEKTSWENVLPELNSYRKALGLPEVGLGHMREE